ncbi:hypothetical protein V6N11_024669 [Hibiscus sabdariffa]|uniref:Uncharacterized protein n=1 Tax=Hibiscus sabdariffa TaxID=183260 RepID=A0ABR2QMU4_9ROSI
MELVNGVFIGCSVNNAVTDGTSFWHFFNTFTEITKGALKISKVPDFCRETVFNSQVVLKFPLADPPLLSPATNRITEISSFQSLCAQLWRSVTRARNLEPTKTTTFRIAVNCRHRLDPKLNPYYFGNAIQSIPNFALVGELLANDMSWGANLLHKNMVAHDNEMVRQGVEDWEGQPRLFPLGNADGASITMGSSPQFLMYKNDFGWGQAFGSEER